MALPDLTPDVRDDALDFATALGDDEYLHGERLSSWLTIAPTLEEDNVLTSIAQDEMGHARLWYELVRDHRDTDVDTLAIYRPAGERRNSQLVERAYDGFADTVVRSLLYDHYERLVLAAVRDGDHADLADRATVALREETFHREHADEWFAVFETLEEESDRERLRRAVRGNLRHAGDLFAFPGAADLVDAGVLDRPVDELRDDWTSAVLPDLAGLPIDHDEAGLAELVGPEGAGGRAGSHTGDLEALLESMQPRELERLDV